MIPPKTYLRRIKMKRVGALCLILAFGYLLPVRSSAEPADVVFKNGNIYTVDDRRPHAEAIAVRTGKIIFVGSYKDVKAFEGRDTRVVDLKGNTVVPGL